MVKFVRAKWMVKWMVKMNGKICACKMNGEMNGKDEW